LIDLGLVALRLDSSSSEIDQTWSFHSYSNYQRPNLIVIHSEGKNQVRLRGSKRFAANQTAARNSFDNLLGCCSWETLGSLLILCHFTICQAANRRIEGNLNFREFSLGLLGSAKSCDTFGFTVGSTEVVGTGLFLFDRFVCSR
jgi:hypothetical protein